MVFDAVIKGSTGKFARIYFVSGVFNCSGKEYKLVLIFCHFLILTYFVFVSICDSEHP